MKSISRLLLSCALLAAAPCGTALSRTPDSLARAHIVRLELKDGNTLVGTVASESHDSLHLVLPSGMRLSIAKEMIEDRSVLDATIEGGAYQRLDPNRSRLFFAPTARPVRSGTGYLAVYELFFPYFAFGIADILTVAGGVSLVPGTTSQLFYLGPKVSIPLGGGGSYLAVGGHYANAFGSNAEGVGIFYAAATLGSHTTAITIGAGYGYAESQFSENPLLIVGGEAQLSGSVKLITENWFPVGSDVSILSLGLRFFGDRVSADFGLYYPVSDSSAEGFPFLPWLSFAYVIGR